MSIVKAVVRAKIQNRQRRKRRLEFGNIEEYKTKGYKNFKFKVKKKFRYAAPLSWETAHITQVTLARTFQVSSASKSLKIPSASRKMKDAIKHLSFFNAS